MKKMLMKEISLTASPLSFIFIAFSLLTFIPQYPILVGAFFICFGIFQSFQKARESNDILYTAMLPIKKTDVVKTKYIFAIAIQTVAFVLIVLFSLLRLFVLNNYPPYNSNKLLNANMVYLGFVLIIFALFNLCFIGGFFKTAYKIGIPFVVFIVAAFLTIGVAEALHFFPSLECLNSNYHYSHLILLAIGVVTYLALTWISYVKSKKNFEKIDL